MDIAILYSSPAGSTEEIAEVIMAVLEEAGHMVMLDSVTSPAAPRQLAAADAVVLGSAIYLEKWTPEMTRFLDDNVEALDGKSLAFFSVGITGEQPRKHAELPLVAEALFQGRMPRDSMWGDPGMGDQRDWSAIREWAKNLAADLKG